jgi:hypothetical protein
MPVYDLFIISKALPRDAYAAVLKKYIDRAFEYNIKPFSVAYYGLTSLPYRLRSSDEHHYEGNLCIIKILAPSSGEMLQSFKKDLKYLRETLRLELIKRRDII